jgi:hypothetical protein
MPTETTSGIRPTSSEGDAVGLEDVSVHEKEVAPSAITIHIPQTPHPFSADFREDVASEQAKGQISTIGKIVPCARRQPVHAQFQPLPTQEGAAHPQAK